jgi:DNA-binding HxlR family transcriptional regulator
MEKDTEYRCTGGGPRANAAPPPEIVAALEVPTGKWRLLIIWIVYRGTMRFNELRRGISGITQHTLTPQLRELEAEGIVRRELFAEVLLRAEYSLTDHGRTSGKVLQTLAGWGQLHLQRSSEDPSLAFE